MFQVLSLLTIATGTVSGMKCPKSDVKIHAGCEMTIDFEDSCINVQKEINQRIEGQYELWHDPHNNGTYSLDSNTDNEYAIHRVTGDMKYTDQMLFNFMDHEDGVGCKVEACSESQVFSIADFGTNYCNLHNLYCADETCAPFTALKGVESVGKCTDSTKDSCSA